MTVELEIFRGPLVFWRVQPIVGLHEMRQPKARLRGLTAFADWALFRTPGSPVRWYGVYLRGEPSEAEVAVSPGEVLELVGQVVCTQQVRRPTRERHPDNWQQKFSWLPADIPPNTIEEVFYEKTFFEFIQLRWVKVADQEARQAILAFVDVE